MAVPNQAYIPGRWELGKKCQLLSLETVATTVLEWCIATYDTEAVLFSSSYRQGFNKQLREAKIKEGSEKIMFNKEATRWLGVLIWKWCPKYYWRRFLCDVEYWPGQPCGARHPYTCGQHSESWESYTFETRSFWWGIYHTFCRVPFPCRKNWKSYIFREDDRKIGQEKR